MDGNGKTRIDELLLQLIDAVKGVGLDLVRTREELKTELGGVKVELAKTREDLGARIDSVREELGGRIDGVKTEVVALKAATAANFELGARTARRRDDEVEDAQPYRPDRATHRAAIHSVIWRPIGRPFF